jgi:hypothetical protein
LFNRSQSDRDVQTSTASFLAKIAMSGGGGRQGGLLEVVAVDAVEKSAAPEPKQQQ